MHALQVNTYQAIIASDSHTSYIIFIYKKLNGALQVTQESLLTQELVPSHLSYQSRVSVMAQLMSSWLVDPANLEMSKKSSVPKQIPVIPKYQELGFSRQPLMLKLVSFNYDKFRESYSFIYLCISAIPPDVNVQSPQFVDPKMQYSEYHRPSRPYLDHQAESELKSLASLNCRIPRITLVDFTPT